MKNWPRFRLRTLLLAFIPAALFFALIGSRLHQAARQRAAADRLEELGFALYYDYGDDDLESRYRPAFRTFWNSELFCRAKEVYFIGVAARFDDSSFAAALPCLESLPYLELLVIHHTAITETSISKLFQLRSLREIEVHGCPHLTGPRGGSLGSIQRTEWHTIRAERIAP